MIMGTWGRLAAVVGVAMIAATACSAKTSETGAGPSCSPDNERYCSAKVGDLLDVTLSDLRPTQPSLGYDEVFYRLGRYTLGAEPEKQLLDAWCATNGQGSLKSARPEARVADPGTFTCEVALGAESAETTAPMKTAVIGPGGQLYLTDGHHTLTSFWEAPGGGPDTHIRLKVAGNLNTSTPGAFWQQMKERGWTWLQDVDGNPIEPGSLPTSLGLKQFANDQYRGVLYFARDVGYAQDDDSPPFQEFYWGSWLRSQTDPSVRPENFRLTELSTYQTLVGNIGKAIVALPGDTAIANSLTADQLGRMKEFGEKAFDALVQPVDSPKPGKLALAIQYKTTH